MMDTKIALITGASRGLGSAIAEALSGSHHIVAVARTTGALEELDDRIQAGGGQATLVPMDITNADAMAHLCRSIYDRWGKVDVWIHTAVHAAPLAPAAHMDAKDWEKSVAINVSATGILIPMVEPLLKMSASGKAVFLRDPQVGTKFFGAYGSTKAAQIALAKSWQAETSKTGPEVYIVTPSPMATACRARFFPGEDRGALADIRTEASRLLAEVGVTTS